MKKKVLGNAIYLNAELGIDLGTDDVVTPNDPGDADSGPNNLQNFPVLTAAAANGSSVDGTLNSTANTTFRVEFFSSVAADPSGHGEGELFAGFTTVTTDGSGNAAFSAALAPAVAAGRFLTATASDPLNNTSEFSAALVVPGVAASATPTPTATETPTSTPTETPTVAATPTETPMGAAHPDSNCDLHPHCRYSDPDRDRDSHVYTDRDADADGERDRHTD